MSEMIVWSPGVTLDQIERQVIMRAYRHFGQNKTVTSNALGIALRTLDYKLERYKQEDADMEGSIEDERVRRANLLARSRGEPEPYPNYVPGGSKSKANGEAKASAGNPLRAESASIAPKELAVPLSQLEEVQALLPSKAPSKVARANR